jgi:hypothetical protein
MFTQSKVSQSIISAVSKVIEESAAKLLLEPEKKTKMPERIQGDIVKSRDDKRASTGHNAVAEEHSDEKEDKALVKKMVKKDALKGESKETDLDSHHKMTSESQHRQNYMDANPKEKNGGDKPKTSWKRDPITAFSNAIHDTVASKLGKKKTNEEVETLDELSRKTLSSYTKQASADLSDKSYSSGHGHGKRGVPNIKLDRKTDKRQQGIEKAVDRLAKEEVDLNEAKSGHEIYHSQYSGAVHHALAHHASKEGLSVHDDDYHQHVSIGPRKPATGETVSHHIPAHNEKGEPHTIHMQIYNRGGDMKPYELNSYSSKIPKRQVKEATESKKTLKHFKAQKEDIGGISSMSEKKADTQVRVDGETDMDTKTIDTLTGRKRVKAEYHNKPLSYKVGLTVGEEVQTEGFADDFLAHAKSVQAKAGKPVTARMRPAPVKPKTGETNEPGHTKRETSGDERGYGKGRYMGDSVELDITKAIAEHKGPESDSEPFVTNANPTNSPLGIAKSMAHRAFKKIRMETMGKIGTSEGKK